MPPKCNDRAGQQNEYVTHFAYSAKEQSFGHPFPGLFWTLSPDGEGTVSREQISA